MNLYQTLDVKNQIKILVNISLEKQWWEGEQQAAVSRIGSG